MADGRRIRQGLPPCRYRAGRRIPNCNAYIRPRLEKLDQEEWVRVAFSTEMQESCSSPALVIAPGDALHGEVDFHASSFSPEWEYDWEGVFRLSWDPSTFYREHEPVERAYADPVVDDDVLKSNSFRLKE